MLAELVEQDRLELLVLDPIEEFVEAAPSSSRHTYSAADGAEVLEVFENHTSAMLNGELHDFIASDMHRFIRPSTAARPTARHLPALSGRPQRDVPLGVERGEACRPEMRPTFTARPVSSVTA